MVGGLRYGKCYAERRRAPMVLRPFNPVRLMLAALVLSGILCCHSFGQEHASQRPQPLIDPPAIESASTTFGASARLAGPHKFWDRENRLLFLASAAASSADFAVTRANLQSGGRDLNPVVRFFGPSTAGLAVNFAGETAGVIAVSYFLHRTGHHRLERIFTMVNIGSSAGAVGYDLMTR
jgi:hypothetical protein